MKNWQLQMHFCRPWVAFSACHKPSGPGPHTPISSIRCAWWIPVYPGQKWTCRWVGHQCCHQALADSSVVLTYREVKYRMLNSWESAIPLRCTAPKHPFMALSLISQNLCRRLHLKHVKNLQLLCNPLMQTSHLNLMYLFQPDITRLIQFTSIPSQP